MGPLKIKSYPYLCQKDHIKLRSSSSRLTNSNQAAPERKTRTKSVQHMVHGVTGSAPQLWGSGSHAVPSEAKGSSQVAHQAQGPKVRLLAGDKAPTIWLAKPHIWTTGQWSSPLSFVSAILKGEQWEAGCQLEWGRPATVATRIWRAPGMKTWCQVEDVPREAVVPHSRRCSRSSWMGAGWQPACGRRLRLWGLWGPFQSKPSHGFTYHRWQELFSSRYARWSLKASTPTWAGLLWALIQRHGTASQACQVGLLEQRSAHCMGVSTVMSIAHTKAYILSQNWTSCLHCTIILFKIMLLLQEKYLITF